MALGAVAVSAVAPYVTNYVSSQAVVNAPLNTVLSPIPGRITRRSPAAGTGVAKGAPLVSVEMKEQDRRYLEQLRARRTQLGQSATAIAAEEARLADLQQEMAGRIRDYSAGIVARLAAETREAEAAVASARAARDNTAATLKRTRELFARGHASSTQADADTAAFAEAEAEVDRLAARLDRIRIEADAAAAGTFVQEGWNDVPYSQQRLDGIVLRRAELATELGRIEAERAALGPQIELERDLAARQEVFRPVAPSAGVIWKESGPVGETVVPGDVLVQMVDCTARFVEVTLPERYFGSIRPGETAEVRLKGGGAAVSARVSAVLGAGAKFDHPRLAAAVAEAGSDQLRVLVSLAGAAIDGEPGNFCQVGRTAEVRFQRRDFGVLRRAAASAISGVAALFTGPELATGATGHLGG